MKCHPQVPQACLLVAAAGSGKSSVYQSIRAVDGGISLIIETAISLGADQTAKIKSASSQSGPVEAFQLDSIKSACDRNSLIKFLKDISPSSNTAMFLFSSPEEILKPCWISCLISLISKKTLKLICIDEVHQFIDFGISFRKSFCLLKLRLFHHIIDHSAVTNKPDQMPSTLKIPVVCMTAAFNATLVTLLEKMINIRFLPKNYFWCGRSGMEKRHIRIEMLCTA